ncbi:enolase-phosphatase E1 isoform X2 [Zootermopsis nevadensis]|uniref:enolase-phosphatase E1 isoform X2 n=1 Tax=Zootermopsis nevadensis TaxID=136037 RepID=UPI000B8ED75A|nr:enolase-phosphatase E1 isoform X2 [Zootermopsis nevadensis]
MDILFPYIRSNLKSYLKAHWNDSEFKEDLVLLREQAKQDEADKMAGVVLIPEDDGENAIEAVAKNVLWQMDSDRKTKALKQLQGHIMREGYKNGKLKGHVFSDVAPALKSWAHNGRQVYIYSSGSVEAQKLLFGHSEEGDLLELFAGHFDTGVGPKVESSSYMNIVKNLECKSEDIVFLTDVPREAKAAQEAGLKAVLVVREGNEPLTEEDQVNFPVIKSFHDFVFEVSAKRKKMSTSDEPLEIVESTANGPVPETTGSSSDKIKADAAKKNEVAATESAGSGNVEGCSEDVEMTDVSNNDAQENNVKTDEMEVESHTTGGTVAVEDCGPKGSEKADAEVKTELASGDLEVSKTDSPAHESKTGMEKESREPRSETDEVKCSKVEIDEKKPKGEVSKTTGVDVKGISVSTQDTKTDSEVPKSDSGDGKAGSGRSEGNLACTESGSSKVASGEQETGLGDAKTSSVDEGAAKANSDNAKAGCNVAKVDTRDTNVDSRVAEKEMSQTEKKMETEIENDGVDAGDTKGTDKVGTDAVAVEEKDQVMGAMKTESSTKVEKKDGTCVKKVDAESGETTKVKEEGENIETSEASAVNKGSEVTKLESEITFHKASDKQSVDLSPSQTESNESASGKNKSTEIADAEPSRSTAESDAKLGTADASLEESSTKVSPKQPSTVNEMLQGVCKLSETPSKAQLPAIPKIVIDTCAENEGENTDEDVKNEKEKGGDESKTAEDTTKENGLASTAENGKDDISEGNNEVEDKEQDVKVKKLSVDSSGNTDKSKDDDISPVAAAASS